METITFTKTVAMPISSVYEILISLGGLRSWLTRDVTGDPKKGGELRLGFGTEQATTVRVEECTHNRLLVWSIVSSTFAKDSEGIGSRISFAVTESKDRGTLLTLKHTGWNGVSEFYRVSGYQWELALLSLVKVCETGRGEPLTPSMLTSRKATGWFPAS